MKKTGKICRIFPTCDTKMTQKTKIFKKYLHMGDLEKNDTMF